MNDQDAEYLLMLAEHLASTPRMGSATDTPEGSSYIMVSETLADQIAAKLREIASR